ncbi:uncharacterized protein LOC125682261 [Ostrea edulis]|uniref:uncharacterized protein LOC125682261 n=1 Tax=Ostrea edulis TaxID=37623 RepID=UPI0024AFB132|nr:uncharacterized protein LOC125682261 [Ostrea edulis]
MIYQGLVALFMLLATTEIAARPSEKERDIEVRDRKSLGSGDYSMLRYVVEKLFSLKSIVEGLEKRTKGMTRAMNSQRKQIESLRNRKETRCETGMVSQHHMKAKWPYTQEVKFKKTFLEVPAVTYGLTALDAGVIKNIRIQVYIQNLTTKGLRFVLRSWADTTLYGATIRWMACAPSA